MNRELATTTQRIATLTGPIEVVASAHADLREDEMLRTRAGDDLAARSVSGNFAYVLLAAILVATAPLDPALATAFGLGTMLLSALRFAVVRQRPTAWHRIFGHATLGIALLWGMFGAVAVQAHGVDQTSLLVLLCVAAVTASATVALAPARGLQRAYGLLMLAPILAMVALQPWTRTTTGLLAMMAAFLGYIQLQGRRVHAEYLVALMTARRLELVNQEIEAVSRAKSNFLADMSHELRTPMTAIRGFSDLLLDSELDDADREYVRTILRNSDHLLAIINEILDLARVEAGRVKIESASMSPARILLDVDALLRERAVERGIELGARVDGLVPAYIESDQLRVRQILINLVSNAIRHTDRGSVMVTVGVDDGLAASPRLLFKVIDTGVGMSAQQIARLFQPFSQVDASAERRAGGTGLGLCISQKLAGALGGWIDIASQPGRGTVATLNLPAGSLIGVPLWGTLRGGPRADSCEESTSERLCGRVLVAEDDEDNRQLIRTQLERVGATVEVASDGAEATRQALAAEAAGQPFGVVLMDMRMAPMDGYSATRALRQAGYRRPIVALTAQAMAGDREKCLAAGCDDFLVKPIEARQLYDALSARLG